MTRPGPRWSVTPRGSGAAPPAGPADARRVGGDGFAAHRTDEPARGPRCLRTPRADVRDRGGRSGGPSYRTRARRRRQHATGLHTDTTGDARGKKVNEQVG